MTDAAQGENGGNAGDSADKGAGGEGQGAENKNPAGGDADKGGGKDAGGDVDLSDSLLTGDDAKEPEAVDFTKGMPKDFPKEAWDDEKKAPKADVLFNKLKEAEARAKGLRDKLAKGADKAPKDVKEYQFKPSEKGAKLFKEGDASKDPLVAAAAPIAHKYGIGKEAFQGFMADMADTIHDLAAKQAEEAPTELSAEEKAEIRKQEYAKIGANAPQVIRAVNSWGAQLKNDGILNEGQHKVFMRLAQTGEDVQVLNILRSLAGGASIPHDFGDDGLPSDDEIANLQAAVKTQADQDKVDTLYEKRRQAGRPEKLQIRG